MSFSFYVGNGLAALIMSQTNLIGAVRGVFQGTIDQFHVGAYHSLQRIPAFEYS